MTNRTSFLTVDYAAILRDLKVRGRIGTYESRIEAKRELERMLNSFVISDEFVYPIIDRQARGSYDAVQS
jgi:hypothetical protein